jgi:hypothetical protein
MYPTKLSFTIEEEIKTLGDSKMAARGRKQKVSLL